MRQAHLIVLVGLVAHGCSGADAPVDTGSEVASPDEGDAAGAVTGDTGDDDAGSAPDASDPALDAGPSAPDVMGVVDVAVDDPPDAGALEPPEPEIDLTEAMFDPDRLLEVEITLAPEDWEILRHQTRTVFEILGPGCMDGPFEAPFTYFPGTVSVDGEVVEEVGVRKKGFLGSMDSERPSLKIKFGEYVDGQELQGLKRMTLNNSRQDPSLLRQCMAYGLFRDAGIIAPRCNWARITVNGQYLGVYVHVDSLKKPFISRNFPDDSGTMWEGTLSDFRPGWMATFEQKLNKTTDDAGGLTAVTDALEASDDALFDTLNAVIDMEQFITFWAMEVMTAHWDGYAGNTNNFYLYEDPEDEDRLTFIPWGTDGSFMIRNKEQQPPEPASIMATGALTHRLYTIPATRLYYLARLQTLLDSVWHDDALLDAIDARSEWLDPYVRPSELDWFVWSTWDLREFVASQRWRIENEIDAGGADWPQDLRNPLCMIQKGTLAASYTTTWGTLHTENAMLAGTGEFSGEIDGQPLSFAAVGASADEGMEAAQGTALIGVFGQAPTQELYIIVLQTAFKYYASETTVPMDWVAGMGHLLYMNPATMESPETMGFIANGSWVIDQAGQTPGAPVTGSVTGDIFVWGD